MICGMCRNEISDLAYVCHYCGAEIDITDEAANHPILGMFFGTGLILLSLWLFRSGEGTFWWILGTALAGISIISLGIKTIKNYGFNAKNIIIKFTLNNNSVTRTIKAKKKRK